MSLVFQNIDPPLRPASVSSPPPRKGGTHTRRVSTPRVTGLLKTGGLQRDVVYLG